MKNQENRRSKNNIIITEICKYDTKQKGKIIIITKFLISVEIINARLYNSSDTKTLHKVTKSDILTDRITHVKQFVSNMLPRGPEPLEK